MQLLQQNLNNLLLVRKIFIWIFYSYVLLLGYLLGKILTDTQKKIINNIDKKIYLYSAHENNIAELLNVLEIFKPLHIPNYGAYVIFEVHKIGGKYGIKVDAKRNVITKKQKL